MRDYRTYKPSKEAVEAFKNRYKSYNAGFSEHRNNLLIMCMLPQENKCQYDFSQTLLGIRFNLMGIAEEIRAQLREAVLEEYKNEGKITFSTYYNGDAESNEKEATNKAKTELSMLALVVKTPDYFGEDGNFYEKRQAIEENIDIFEEDMRDIARQEVMDYFKDFRVEEPDDDDDI